MWGCKRQTRKKNYVSDNLQSGEATTAIDESQSAWRRIQDEEASSRGGGGWWRRFPIIITRRDGAQIKTHIVGRRRRWRHQNDDPLAPMNQTTPAKEHVYHTRHHDVSTIRAAHVPIFCVKVAGAGSRPAVPTPARSMFHYSQRGNYMMMILKERECVEIHTHTHQLCMRSVLAPLLVNPPLPRGKE
jgi:hypothetical protein